MLPREGNRLEEGLTWDSITDRAADLCPPGPTPFWVCMETSMEARATAPLGPPSVLWETSELWASPYEYRFP